jgi:hypothetical protein
MKLRKGPGMLLLALLVGTAALLIGGCGDDDDDGAGEGAQPVRISVKDGEDPTVSTEQIEAGLAEITLETQGKKRHDAQLFRVVGDHPPAEVIETVTGVVRGDPLPGWLFAGGGVGPIPGGQSQTVTQVLEPGTYYVADIEGSVGPPTPKTVARFEVSGDTGDAELPEEETTVEAFDYGFRAEGLETGRSPILFENAGEEPHHIIAAPIVAGKTIADVRKFVRSERGKPPIDARGSVTTAVLEGGTSQIVSLRLQSGDYALLCFISDREGGPPHALKGMISPASVE